MDLARKVGRYIEGRLTLSGGDLDGEPFEVLAWERRFLRGVFRPGIQTAALSVGRGNGKSALVAAIAAAVVDPEGPLHGPRREVVCVGPSFEQSRIIFEDVLAFLEDRYDLDDRRRWRKANTANRALLEWRKTGCRVRCIGSDPSTAHGLRPFLALLDEPAQYDAAKADRMLAAIRTGLGKVPGSRLVALGTRPATDGHWFARMLSGGADYSQVHAARPDAPPFQRRTWRRANPSLDVLPSLEEAIRSEAAAAKLRRGRFAKLPGPSSKHGRTGRGGVGSRGGRVLDAGRIASGSGDAVAGIRARDRPGIERRNERRRRLLPGRDLGGVRGVPRVAEPGRARSRGRRRGPVCADGTPGELFQSGRRVSDPGALLREALDRWGRPVAVVCDRWRVAELRQALESVGFPIAAMVERGMGFKDGGADVRDFRAAVLGSKVRPSQSLLLRAALAEARVTSDPAGNSKLAKNAQGGRRLRRVTMRRRRRSWPSRRASGSGTAGPRSGPLALCGGGVSLRSAKGSRWQRIRRSAFERDGFRCRACGRPGRLEAHHVRPLERGGDPYDLANIETLCRGCHIDRHRRQRTPAEIAWARAVRKLP